MEFLLNFQELAFQVVLLIVKVLISIRYDTSIHPSLLAV